jgi:autotransporter-associated beta strand protein
MKSTPTMKSPLNTSFIHTNSSQCSAEVDCFRLLFKGWSVKVLSLMVVVMVGGRVWGQTTIFSENMGAGSTTTFVNSYTGWQNSSSITFSSSGTQSDVRNSLPSSSYSGSSGTGNLFMGTATTNTRDFVISGINTLGYTGLSLSFGLNSTSVNNVPVVEYSTNGTSYTALTVVATISANTWSLKTATGSIPNTSTLYIKFSKTSNVSFRIDDVKITGTVAATPSIAITNGTIAAGSPNNGQTNVVLQRYDMAVTTANATLTGLTVNTAGTYAAADLTNLKCWYQTSTTFNAGTATLLSTKTTALDAGSHVFPSFTSQAISSGSTGYIFVTADIATGATNGNTINIASNAFSNITFSSGTKTGTDPVAAAGVQTITVAVPDIALSSPAAYASDITVGTTNNVLYRFDLVITTATPSLTGVTINTSTGSNIDGDLTNLKCWYQTSTTFNSGTATLLSTKTTSLAAGSHVFPSFSSQSLTSGSTYYIFITADVPLTATPNNTIVVSAITTANLSFATGNKTGTANASGTKTIINCTPADVTSAAASIANNSSVLTWVNPACYDEILIVAALASNSGTPTGNGSAYTGNLVYGSGIALGNGFVVYKGSTNSQTVTGLTNGTQYFFKYFTRRGTTWTSGTEVNATPNVSGYYWNGASIVANPSAGGTGTWGTANSWRQPSSSGAQATWADANNAIFGGTAGTVTLPATASFTSKNIQTSGYLFNGSSVLTGNIIQNTGVTSVYLDAAVTSNTTFSLNGNFSGGTAINFAAGATSNNLSRLNLGSGTTSTNYFWSTPIIITGNGFASIGSGGTGNNATSTFSGNISGNGSRLNLGATTGYTVTFSGIVNNGSGDVRIAMGSSGGGGTVIFSNANNSWGETSFNAGSGCVVKLGIANALPTATNVTMANSSGNGGIFDLNGFDQTIGSLTSGAGVGSIINNGPTDATLTISGSTSPAAFVLVIADGQTNKTLLTKAGTGKLTLSGANTYTGVTTLNEGILQFSKVGGNTIPVGNSVIINGGTLQISSNQTLETITLNSGIIQVDNGVTLTINNLTIPNGATLRLLGTGKISGSGTFILSSGSTLISDLSISSAILNYNTKSFSSLANYELNGEATGTFTTTPTPNTVNNLTINKSSGAVTLNQSFTTTGALTLTSGTLDIGANTLTIAGSISRTNGNIDSDAGTLSFDNTNNLSLPTSLFSGNIYNLSKAGGAGTVTLNDNLTVTNLLTSAASTGAFIIPSSKVLTVSGTGKATINGTLTNDGTFTLNSGATLLQGSGSITGGAYNVKQNITCAGTSTPSGRFWYVGSPVSGATSAVYDAAGANILKYYSEPANAWQEITDNNAALEVGRGYFVQAATGTTELNFTGGTINNNTYTLNVTRNTTTNAFRGYNLLTNPYPSYLDWDNVTRSNVGATIWYRSVNNAGTMVFDTYNAPAGTGTNINGLGEVTKFIPPMQSFWVSVPQGQTSGTVSFGNDQRSHYSTGVQGLRSTAQDFPAFLRLNLLDGNFVDQTILYMKPDANNTFDEYDSEKMFLGGVPQFYSTVNAKKLVLNGMKNQKVRTSVPLTMELPTSKSYTFQAEEFNIEDGLILLEDKQEGVIQDLTINPTYSFFGNAGTNATRFVVHFQLANAPVLVGGPLEFESLGSEDLTTDNIQIFSNNQGTVVIRLDEGFKPEGSIQIFDASGRLVEQTDLNDQETTIQLNEQTGMYFVEVAAGKLMVKKKIVIQ